MCAAWCAVYGGTFGALPITVLAETSFDGVGYAFPVFAAALGAVRGSVVKVVATPDVLFIRNPFWTYRVPWNEIEEIVDVQPWWFKGLVCPGVRKYRGRRPIPIVSMVTWDRLVSSQTARSGIEAAFTIRRWAREHRVEASALSFIRREHSPSDADV